MLVLIRSHLAAEFPELLAELRERFPSHEILSVLERDEFDELLPRAEAVVTNPLSAEQLERARSLRVHFIPYAGADKVDFDAYTSRNITVVSNHGNAEAVAERAMALALALLGRIVEFHNDLAHGQWHRTGYPEKPFDYWTSLRGKSCAILGTGAIGSAIARMLVGFECPVLGYNSSGTNPNPALFHTTTTRLSELLSQATVAFVTLPLTQETRGLIGTEKLELLGEGALINVSRGEIVDEEALFTALKGRHLLGAGLDTWYHYPKPPHASQMPARLPFWDLPNVVMSPHAGSHTIEGKRGQLMAALAQVVELLEHGEPAGAINAAKKY